MARARDASASRTTDREVTVPRGKRGATDPLEHVRELCLALPEAEEKLAWGEPTFRVRNKLFAMYANADTHHGKGIDGVWIKSTHVNQDLLIRDDPERYFVPPYVGPGGWVGVRLSGDLDWEAVGDLLRDGYRLIAPKKLVARLDEG